MLLLKLEKVTKLYIDLFPAWAYKHTSITCAYISTGTCMYGIYTIRIALHMFFRTHGGFIRMHGMAHLLDFVSNISSRECFIRMLWLYILCEEFFFT